MSWLSDSTPLVDGWLSSAYPGHGIRGADVPSSGLNGPAILYPGLSLPAEADDEFRALILTRPSSLPGLVIGEDSSVDSGEAPPDGVHVGTWRGYKNGVVYGPDPSTYTITIGGAGGALSGNASLDGIAAGGGLGGGTPTQLSGGATLDGIGAGGSMGQGALDLQALPMYTLFAPRDQIDNLGGFGPKDPEARVLLAFEFKRWLLSVQDAQVGIIRWRGAADASPEDVLDGQPQLRGTRVFQWVQGGVLNTDYELRVVATGPDGSKAVLEGILPVRDA
jgi:hypothetical protein